MDRAHSRRLKARCATSAQIFLLPSHHESFGIAVAEALACGLPTLISNKVNIWREVAESGGGLVADDDLRGTLFLLRTWAMMPSDEKAQMRKSARKCFEESFEVDHASAMLLATLAKIVDTRTHPVAN